jgi:4a-hydroxytetrahydrobiopterin dehydratase
MASLLNDTDIQTKLSQLDGWTRQGDAIETVKTFDGFPSAISFVNKLVDPAEAAGHHPDLSVSYNKVTITLSTHDMGGLTNKDFDMAATINGLV